MRRFGKISAYLHQLCYNHAIHLEVVSVLYQYKFIDSEPENTDENISNSEDENFENDMDFAFNDELYDDGVEVPAICANYQPVLKIVRKIIGLFKWSAVKNDVLQNFVKEEHGRELKLLYDSNTRWNSLYQLLDRFILIFDSIQEALSQLNDHRYKIDLNAKTYIIDLVKFLKPILIAVEALSRRDTTIITADGMLKFLFDEFKLCNSTISKQLLDSIANEITKRRNVELVTLIKYLQNPNIFKHKENESEFLPLWKIYWYEIRKRNKPPNF